MADKNEIKTEEVKETKSVLKKDIVEIVNFSVEIGELKVQQADLINKLKLVENTMKEKSEKLNSLLENHKEDVVE